MAKYQTKYNPYQIVKMFEEEIDDGTDVYFMQVASSWGQLFTQKQWLKFEQWQKNNSDEGLKQNNPKYLDEWGQHSWKKHFITYLISQNKYFVFPRLSLSTNCEEEGTNSKTKNIFHVPLQTSLKDYLFCPFNESNTKYDAWFELSKRCLNKLNKDLSQYDYEVDLYGTKDAQRSKHEFILTSKSGTEAIMSFASEVFPLETNVALKINGTDIGLFPKNLVLNSPPKHPLKYLLRETNNFHQTRFSVYIIVEQWNKTDFDLSIDSVQSQGSDFAKIFILTQPFFLQQINQAIFYLESETEVLVIDQNKTWIEVFLESTQKEHESIVTWLYPGSILSPKSFGEIENVFNSYKNIVWLRAMNQLEESSQELDLMNTRPFRLVASEAYSLFKQNKLVFSFELNFVRSNCFKEILIQKVSSPIELFFHLIKQYQMHLLVAKLGKTSSLNMMKLHEGENDNLQLDNLGLAKHENILDAFLNYLSKSKFIQFKFSKWLYTSKKNYPDVLRYDEINKTYFFSKF